MKKADLPGGSVVNNPPANAGDPRDVGSIPGSGRSLGERNGNLLQYSCPGNPWEIPWWATVLELDTTEHADFYGNYFYTMKSQK